MSTESVPFDGKIVTNTLAGMKMQTSVMLGLDMEYDEKSTINEHLSIQSNVLPASDLKPEMRYLVVGNKGHAVSDAADGLITPVPLRHQPTDVAPYGIRPLALRALDNDFSEIERLKYVLRRKEEHGGRYYWAYYGLVLDNRAVKCLNYYTKVRDGIETVDNFEYSDINLYPKPSVMPDYNYEVNTQLTPDDGDYVHSAATMSIVFDEAAVEEYMNVANILYGDPRKAVISELALCHGIETKISAESATGSPFLFDEVIGCQVNIFITTFSNLAFSNKGIAHDIQIGQNEPMALALDQVPSI